MADQFPGKDIVTLLQIRASIFSDRVFPVFQNIIWQIVRADRHGFQHGTGDLRSLGNILFHPDDLTLFSDRAVHQRRNAEADNERQQDAEKAEDGTIFQEIPVK